MTPVYVPASGQKALIIYVWITPDGGEEDVLVEQWPIVAWAIYEDWDNADSARSFGRRHAPRWATPVLPRMVDVATERVGIVMPDEKIFDVETETVYPSVSIWKSEMVEAARTRARAKKQVSP